MRNSKAESFITTHYTECIHSHTELILVLAIMDLPFVPGNHRYESEEGKKGLLITAASNLIVYLRDITESEKEIVENDENESDNLS